MSTESVIPSNQLLLLPLVFPSIRLYSNESALPIRWPKYQKFSFSISSKASILQHSAFFIVQPSHPYMTTAKKIVLTRQIFVGKVISLLFNMLSRLFIAFLPRRNCLLIPWLQSPSAVTLEPKKIKSVTVSIVSPSVRHEVMGPGCHDHRLLNVEF